MTGAYGFSVIMYAFLSDGEQPHLSTTNSPVERPKKTVTKRHDDDDGSDDDGGRSRHCKHK